MPILRDALGRRIPRPRLRASVECIPRDPQHVESAEELLVKYGNLQAAKAAAPNGGGSGNNSANNNENDADNKAG